MWYRSFNKSCALYCICCINHLGVVSHLEVSLRSVQCTQRETSLMSVHDEHHNQLMNIADKCRSRNFCPLSCTIPPEGLRDCLWGRSRLIRDHSLYRAVLFQVLLDTDQVVRHHEDYSSHQRSVHRHQCFFCIASHLGTSYCYLGHCPGYQWGVVDQVAAAGKTL